MSYDLHHVRTALDRWSPSLTMMLVSMISYIDRNALALLAPTILAEVKLSTEMYGWVISAFSFAYMLGNPVWGRILDRVGLRKGMSAAVGLWTAASAAHAFAGGFWSFATARAVLGFGEGATFPGGMRTAVQTLDPAHRSRGIAISYSGGSLGAIVTPIIITPVALVWGWRGAFWFTGAVGTAWLLLWAWLSRRKDLRGRPEPSANVETTGGSGDALDWRDPRLFAFIAAYALGAFPLAFVLYNSSLYLSRVFHKSQGEIGAVLWIPPLGWELGYFFWGWLVDRFAARGASDVALRRLFFVLMLASLPLAATPRVESYALTLAMLFFAMFVVSGFVIGAIAYATNIFSSRYAGLLAGIGAGSWSAAVALGMPRFGWLFDRERWSEAFVFAALVPVAGWLLWRVLSSARK